jgi:hypothetical protein
MQYFNKMKGSALNIGIQILNSVSEISNHESTKLSSVVHIKNLFSVICETLESLESLNATYSDELGQKLLNESKIKLYIKSLLSIIKQESELWSSEQVYDPFANKNENTNRTIGLDFFLQSDIVSELCNRAMNDVTKSFLPLLLKTFLSPLLKFKYPFLPHTSIHRPIALLIAFTYRRCVQLENDSNCKKSIGLLLFIIVFFYYL